jgi:hypothetical protein
LWQNRKRYSHNVTANVHYTWGKSLSYTGGDNAATFNDDSDNSIQNFFDVKSNRGPSVGDRTHVISTDWIIDLPKLAAMANPFIKAIVGGWQATGILRAQTGGAFFRHPARDGGPSSRPDLIKPGAEYADNYRDTLVYLNPAAFLPVPLSSVSKLPIRPGTAGHNAFRGPGSWTVDSSLGKNFAFTEKVGLQIRADLFNALNHTNLSNPVSVIDDPNFGKIQGTGGARTIQLNARLSF